MSQIRIEGLRFLDKGPVHLTVDAGQCVVLSGASGSGKTLLLRAVADLDPHAGRVYLDGIECSSLSGPEWRRRVALLPAEPRWWHDAVGPHFPAPDLDALAQLGFAPDVLEWEVRRLSTGERQRLAVARMLANGPQAFLLDEPTANLDPENTLRVEQLIRSYQVRHAAAALWVTHDRVQAHRVATVRLILDKGHLLPDVT